ncbi:hypothetical protein ACIRVK_03190 [Streptomyces sp. NPDC101152]|uniref:hypothetical protein n=1 Tax=Streptomyces sp. NPDC101152 TaxID=3366116 RepID=UPI003815942E
MSKFSGVIAGLAALGITVVLATPGEAAPLSSGVSADTYLSGFTLYENSNFGGCATQDTLQGGSLVYQKWGYFGCLTYIDNEASSMRNNYAQSIFLYDKSNCTGAMYIAKPKSEDKTFDNNNFNDKASCISY